MPGVKLYTEIPLNQSHTKGEWIDIIKPFVKNPDRKTGEGPAAGFELSDNMMNSDWVVLPLSWNYYHKTRQIAHAISVVRQAEQAGKQVLSWTSGDFGVRIPHFPNLTVLRPSGYRSQLPSNHQGMPVFFSDPLQKYFGTTDVIIREKQEKPIIGFCGQAEGNLLKYGVDIVRTAGRNLAYYTGLSAYEPQSLYPSTLLRSQILKNIAQADSLSTNYIIRSKYRAGATTPEEKHATSLEFYKNMVESDYVVCVRGGGNFSVRLYETLAMGRIPVFVDTDCLLPLEDKINWRKHVVRVESKNSAEICNSIIEFHNKLNFKDFVDLQKSNRQLWNDKLSLHNFFKCLFMHPN